MFVVVCCRLLPGAGCLLFVGCNVMFDWLLFVCCLFFVVCGLLFVVCSLLIVPRCSLLVA